VKGHQDNKKSWDKLDMRAQINVLADRQADEIYRKSPGRTGLFPTWVPGTGAALFHNDAQVTKGIPEYIRDAKHTPEMKQYLIRRSHTASPMTSHGAKRPTHQSTGSIMVRLSRSYPLASAFSYRSTPTTFSPWRNGSKSLTTRKMATALHATNYGRIRHTSSRVPVKHDALHKPLLD
jgi:hypothetical protein